MRDYEPYYTEDGSIGLYSYADKDVYHSKFGALTEAWEKFVLPSNVDDILKRNGKLYVLDVCYGIGYNTKALMSHIIDKNHDKLKRKNFFIRLSNIVSICINNIINLPSRIIEKLLNHNVTIYDDNSSDNNGSSAIVNIDCIDINEELIKLSPMFITLKTPNEIYSDIVPDVLSCFDLYYKIKNLFVNILSKFYPKNKKSIKELLDLKFKNMHRKKEYKVNKIANYILLNRLYEKYQREYFNKDMKKLLKNRKTHRFFDKSYIKYAKFNHIWGYNLSSSNIISTNLHNIYYNHISKRNNNIDFKKAESLFNINFYTNDARKTISDIKIKYDCIYLDAFTFTKAPQLWSVEFIAKLYDVLSDDGVLLTYSNSVQVRNTLLENKFYVGKIYNADSEKFVGTIASKDKSKIKYPLTNYELGLCQTKAGIPYHDPNLSLTNKEMLELREYEFMHSNLMSSSKYMKIRSLRGGYE